MREHPTCVVLLGTAIPARTALEEPVAALAARGAHAHLLLLSLPPAETLEGLALRDHRRVVLWRPRPDGPPRLPRRVVDGLHYRALKVLNLRSPASVRLLRMTRRDPVARALVQGADVLVALDRHAAHAARTLGRGRPAFLGVPAAVRHLDPIPTQEVTR